MNKEAKTQEKIISFQDIKDAVDRTFSSQITRPKFLERIKNYQPLEISPLSDSQIKVDLRTSEKMRPSRLSPEEKHNHTAEAALAASALLGIGIGTTAYAIYESSQSANVEAESVIGSAVQVPSAVSEIKVKALNAFNENEWFHPIYDPTTANIENNWRGIGPWYPIEFANIDKDAAILTSHGNPGEIVVKGKNGGKVQIGFMQLDKHQNDGKWGHDENGNTVKNEAWEMQYTFHGLRPGHELSIVNPDTGELMLWDDGVTPVIFKANELGTASFAVPKTNGNDIRWAVTFDMIAQLPGVQAPEIKIERGPNDHPELAGENPLPRLVIKPAIPEASVDLVGAKVETPQSVADIKVSSLTDFIESKWFHPIYDPSTANIENNWRGIGPWYPVAFTNIDSGAAILTSHGNPGELVVKSKNGGKIQIAFNQLNNHQNEGKWGHDADGNVVRNDSWTIQYTFHGLKPFQEMKVVDPDTGEQLFWNDGISPVIYKANELGTASFELPKTINNDVRVGFEMDIEAQQAGIQGQEIKIERGPNDHPELAGENPLPKGVIKPALPETKINTTLGRRSTVFSSPV